MPKSGKKSFSKNYPYIFIFFVPVIIALFCLIFYKEPKNNSVSETDESSINWESYSEKEIELSSSLRITSPGIYILSGTLGDGTVEINTDGIVKIILNNASITNENGPAILAQNAKTVFIETADNSINYLYDAESYDGFDEDIKGTLFSKANLVLGGSGILSVVGNHEDAIVGKDKLEINSGTYIINSKDEGIRGRDSVYIAGGDFTIQTGGDAIKSNNDEGIGKGTITINDGTFVISAGDDGIHAESSVEINGGVIEIKKSYEGIEGSTIKINNGDIKVVSSDDGLNSAGGNDSSSPNTNEYKTSSANYWIEINGGILNVDSAGDGIDSNGSLTINGGEVYVNGPTNSANGALDSETGIVYNGGTIVAVGASGMASAPSNSSSKNSLSVFFDRTYPAGTVISVKDLSGNTILSFVPAKAFSHAVISSENFVEGTTYQIFLNDSEYETIYLSGRTTRSGSPVSNGFRR